MDNVSFGMKKRSWKTMLVYWPFLVLALPFFLVYGLGAMGYENVVGRKYNELIAMPLVLVSVLSYGVLALRTRNEFAMVQALLSIGFFCREWHFAGTSKGVYVVVAIVAGWYVCRRRPLSALIGKTRVEIWLWATCACYILSQVIARRVFGSGHLNLLPMESYYHIALEETTETLAHLMLAMTSFAAWRHYRAKTEEIYGQANFNLHQSAGGAERVA